MGGRGPDGPFEDDAPEPGAVEPGMTGAGAAVHGAPEGFGEPEPTVEPEGTLGFASGPCLRLSPERP